MTRRAVRTPRTLGALPPVRHLGVLGWLLVIGCTPLRPVPVPPVESPPTPVGAPIPVPEKQVPVDPLAPPWVVGRATNRITHLIEVNTVVRAAATTEALARAPADSLRTSASVRWEPSGSTTQRAGTVLAWRTGLDIGEPQTPRDLSLPIAIAARLDAMGGSVRLITPAEGSCGTAAAAGQLVREPLFAAPERLAPGLWWADSVETTICRDSVPLTLRSMRQFVVEGARFENGRAVLVVVRRTTSSLRGSGRQFGEAVTLSGEGRGELRFTLDLDDGQMVAGSGSSTLRLTLSGRRKTQVVAQDARLEIRRAP